jgi:DNA repair exonuclease SbcCD ATPase subunit
VIKIKQLTIKNFLSVGAVTQGMNLSDTGLTLVLGSNSDANGGVTRNGAGKSTILQAISYALYSKPLTKIKIPNLINNINGKGMLVTIEFEDATASSYKIERGKKPDVMKFYKSTTKNNVWKQMRRRVRTNTPSGKSNV